jgi:hypothetical protein
VGQQVLEGRQHALAGTDAVRQVAIHQQLATDRGERCAGVTPDERPTAPGLSSVRALEQVVIATLAEMSITAQVLGLGVPLVTAYHVVRVFMITLFTLPMYRLGVRLFN